ncbi:DNA-binding transcriptional regulator, MarR family [Pedobacter westerhofensis]|uniref:DNA-binding transcriptional regulator, MarR family n=1 Tax=Pedobacter westerhofensis TaxID=425512 RepID=A0A521BRG5_9SPHI|nr:MarR family winged helix-turn-helix transcriptional regulator [Pedobacter westerhofensis]SMO49130.1 DNA-binding transcriptional regulator, MarR family [Pedobacter westerhofensis]
MNIINELGILAIAARLQRLAEQIRKDGVLIYKANGIDFEPKWFPVMYTLHVKPILSVVEVSAEIGYSHPSTISLLKELEKQKLIKSGKDKSDERKRMIQLTEKGRSLIKRMEPVWEVMIAAAEQLTETENNLMKAMAEVEQQMEVQSFYQRAKVIMAADESRK